MANQVTDDYEEPDETGLSQAIAYLIIFGGLVTLGFCSLALRWQ